MTKTNQTTLYLGCLLFLAAAPEWAQAQNRPDPVADLRELKAAEGFEINLFAADPAIAKPIQMNFDRRGRLWVVSSESYPQLRPGEKPADKVFVLEDADGDGRADKTTQYAAGLLIPTGIEVGPQGPYVGQSTELVRIDAKSPAEPLAGGVPRAVLAGFGTEDTHHLIHSFRWSPDGWLFFGQSIYIHSHVETPWGVQRLNGGGFWMFRPESHRLGVFVHGMVNSWGIAWDEFGQAFGVDNHDGPNGSPIKWFFPGARFEFTPDEPKPLQGIVFDKPKYCGAEFVTGEHFPESHRGNFVTCDFRAHRVVRYRLEDDGAGFRAVELSPLIESIHPNFRPVDVKMGPDGALYICDWYNPIINHGEVDFRDPRRDKLHGRIWRLRAKGRPLDRQPDFDRASTRELVAMQGSPNGWTRHFARRALAERRSDAVTHEVDQWLATSTNGRNLLAGVWTCESVHRGNIDLLNRCLAVGMDPRVRAAALRVAGWTPSSTSKLDDLRRQWLRDGVVDPNPRVRLEAIRSLANCGATDAMEVAVAAYRLSTDRFLEHALRRLAIDTADQWLPRAASLVASARDAAWARPLLEVERAETVAPLWELHKSGRLKGELKAAALSAIGRRGGPTDLAELLDYALAEKTATVEERMQLLDAIAVAGRLRGIRPTGDLNEFARRLLAQDRPALQSSGIQVLGAWRFGAATPLVAAVAEDPGAKLESRVAAIETLERLEPKVAAVTLRRLAEGESVSDVGQAVVSKAAFNALVNVDAGAAAELIVRALDSAAKTALVARLEPILQTQRGPVELAKQLSGRQLTPAIAQEMLRVANAAGQLMPELTTLLAKAAGLPPGAQGPSDVAMKRLAQLAISKGDPVRGRAVFRSEKLQCMKCHRIGSEGGEAGPTLTTIGVSAPLDYLVESLFWPDRKIKENFHSMVVATESGQVVTGLLVKKTTDELVLRNAENKLVSIPTREIESSRVGGSIMPMGLLDTATEADVVDLIRYLAELGKGETQGSAAIARDWQLLGPIAGERAPEIEGRAVAGKPLAWQSSLTTNDGWVYLREFALTPQLPILFAAAELEVAAAGKVRLRFRPADARLWIDGKPLMPGGRVGQDASVECDLALGRHRLLFRMDLSKRPTQLRLEMQPLDDRIKAAFVIPGA